MHSNGNYLLDPNSIVVDYNSGILFMVTDGGSFFGNGPFILGDDEILTPTASFLNPDITAYTATFFALTGAFGTTLRPIVLDVQKANGSSVLIDTRTVNFDFFPETPDNLISTGIDIGSLGVLSAVAGELLVEIESLGDIDPAIFTDLQNYSREEISILMPRDQLFEDEYLEEELEDELVEIDELNKFSQL